MSFVKNGRIIFFFYKFFLHCVFTERFKETKGKKALKCFSFLCTSTISICLLLFMLGIPVIDSNFQNMLIE